MEKAKTLTGHFMQSPPGSAKKEKLLNCRQMLV
jgi:hypothetical protein